MGLVTLTFDLLTLKLVCESHLRWGTLHPKLGTLRLWVLELFAIYATDKQMDGRTDKSNAYCPFPTGDGIINGECPESHKTTCKVTCKLHEDTLIIIIAGHLTTFQSRIILQFI